MLYSPGIIQNLNNSRQRSQYCLFLLDNQDKFQPPNVPLTYRFT